MITAKVRFFGRPTGFSGYSHATQYIAEAFSKSGVPVLFKSTKENTSFSSSLSTYDGACNVDFYIHTPPFSRHKSNNYKIGYFYWETDTLPGGWSRDIRHSLDEIWVPCDLTKKACRKAGFKGPIEIVHTPRPSSVEHEKVAIPLKGSDKFVVGPDTYIFYSIFQWNERKGYRKLVRAYQEEFSSKDDALMVIKTNPIKHKDHGISKIKRDLLSMKRYHKDRSSSPIFLITEKLSENHIAGLHDRGDCFVLPHHGEGWGMPIHDAMAHRSLVITTPFGGITEHLSDSSALLIKHNLIEVKPMDWNPYYTRDQRWADPDLSHLKSLMRMAYEGFQHREDMIQKASDIANRMSINTLSSRINKIFSQDRLVRLRR